MNGAAAAAGWDRAAAGKQAEERRILIVRSRGGNMEELDSTSKRSAVKLTRTQQSQQCRQMGIDSICQWGMELLTKGLP